jgi:hypothetical protein
MRATITASKKNFCTVRQLLDGLGVDLTAVTNFPLLNKMLHISHWMQPTCNVSAQSMAMSFSRGAGIVCKYNQQDIDLLIPVLLDDRKETWEAEPKLPIVGSSGGPAHWAKERKEKVLKNFSAVIVQVKNNKKGCDPKRNTVHESIQKRASIIFDD